MTASSRDLPVLRVTQLDTNELDDALLVNIKQSLNQDFFKYVQFNFFQKYHTEIFAGIKLIIWYNTYLKQGQTVAQSIFDWNYQDQTTLKKCCHMIIYCFDEWILEKLPHLLKLIFKCLLVLKRKIFRENKEANATLEFDIMKKIDKMFNYLRVFINFCTYLNYLVFLFNGKYLSFWERVFRLRPIYKTQQFMRNFDHTLFERELLWQSYFSLFKLVDGLFDFKKLQAKFKRKLQLAKLNQTRSTIERAIDINVCGICDSQPPTMVHCSVNFSKDDVCKHVFCYVCIKKALKENGGQYFCHICDKYVNNVEMYLINQNI